jgi:hypothetical protein
VNLGRLAAVALVAVTAVLGIAVGYAQGQVVSFRLRDGGDGSIYVDAVGGYTIPLPSAVGGFTFVLSYNSTYLKPGLLREVARATTTPGLPTGYLSLGVTSSSTGASGSAVVRVAYRAPTGSAYLEAGLTTRRIGFELLVSAEGDLVVEKSILPEDLRTQLPLLVSTLRNLGAGGLSNQLAAAGVTWLRVEELEVDLKDLGARFEVPFKLTGRLDYAAYATWLNLSLDTVERCLSVSESLNTSAGLRLELTPAGMVLEYSSERIADDLERVYLERSRCSRELFRVLPPYPAVAPVAPAAPTGPSVEVLQQLSTSLTKLQNLTEGLALLPSNASATVRVEAGGTVNTYVDVRNLRLTHVDGVGRATAVVVAVSNTLGSLGLSSEVYFGGLPCDWDYAKELTEAVVGLVRALLAAWFTPVGWTAVPVTVVPPPPTPPTAVTVVITAVVRETATVSRTVATVETLVKTETAVTTLTAVTTVTQVPGGYGLEHLATVGVAALALGAVLGYLARRR